MLSGATRARRVDEVPAVNAIRDRLARRRFAARKTTSFNASLNLRSATARYKLRHINSKLGPSVFTRDAVNRRSLLTRGEARHSLRLVSIFGVLRKFEKPARQNPTSRSAKV